MLLTLLPLAHALPALTDSGFVLRGPASGNFSRGVGAPTVAWDGAQWVMYFEALTANPPAACAKSLVIGRATSPDGRTWTLSPDPVLTPDTDDPTSPYHCAVTHPAVVYDGTTWHLFFTAWGASPRPPWTWNLNNGVSYATSTDGVTFGVDQAPTPIGDYAIGSQDWYEPDGGGDMPTSMATAVRVNDKLWMLFVAGDFRGTSERVATFDLATRTWSIGKDNADTTAFARGNGYSPGLVCVAADKRVVAVVAGFSSENSESRRVGAARSDDLIEWDEQELSDPVLVSAHHLEPVLAGDATLVYYSKPDTDGRPAIGVAADRETWGTPVGRVCAWEEDTGPDDSGTDDSGTDDSGADSGDGDSGGDSGPAADDPPDDATPKESGWCGCGTGGASVAWLPALALLVRRRRAGPDEARAG